MGRLWCAALPTVTVPVSDTPKPVTLILPFYENQRFVDQYHLPLWRSSDYQALRAWLTVVLVDDGSPTPFVPPADPPVTLRAFRIMQDVRWNWLAARNIGARHADDGWLLLTDIDHLVPPDTLRAVLYGRHDPATIYAFSRREHTGEVIHPHSASFLMTKAMFWRIGGYDEALSGHYGTDGDYRRRAHATAPMQVLTDALIRYEYVEDSSTSRYLRKQPEDAGARHLIRQRGPGWQPRVLSFPYEELAT